MILITFDEGGCRFWVIVLVLLSDSVELTSLIVFSSGKVDVLVILILDDVCTLYEVIRFEDVPLL